MTKVLTFSGPSRTTQLLAFDDWLLMGLAPGARDVELWRSDGTVPGTQRLHRASPAEEGGPSLASLETRVLFTSSNELWSTDATPAGTARVQVLPDASFTLQSTGSRVFMRSFPGALWQSDGTEAGTQAVPGAPSSISDVRLSQGRAWYSVADPFVGGEPWTSDGTANGSRLLLDLNPGPRDSMAGEFTPLGDLTFFRATESASGIELWKSDGTAGGTQRVADLAPGSWDSAPFYLYPWKDHLYFWVLGAGMGNQLYRSDGTEGGTARVSAAVTVPTDIAGAFQGWGDLVFFVASDAEGGTELWRTDGTPQGTVLVADLNPGAASSRPASLTLMSPEGPLLFVATSPDTGRELWRIDEPTARPTVVEVLPGSGASAPANLTALGPVLYFTATDATGEGLFKLPELVRDVRPPRLTCPADQQVAATSAGGATVTFPAAAARDDSGEAPAQTADPASGTLFPIGVNEVTVIAVDGADNRARCTFNVTVEPWVGVDAGTEDDGGTPPADGGMETDAGVDAGVPPEDAGTEPDAGEADAGTEPRDAGSTDAGSADAGSSEEPPPPDTGCGCQSATASVPWGLMLLGLCFVARRRPRKRLLD
ncbi:ELWxxDGT repeat protein [Pyxidicoccus sp. 3LFB2]